MGIRKLSSILTVCASLSILMYSATLGWAQAPLQPVQRIPRAQFGVVGAFPLTANDLDAMIFPSATAAERQAVLDGLTFFTTPHTAAEGAGPDANQPFCQGCHLNSAEVPRNAGLIRTSSQISRASRSTPTNFNFTALDPATGGGRAPDQDNAITNTGRTAAFTIFGDFKPPLTFNGLSANTGANSPNFGGFVQHVRPSLPACLPDRIPPIAIDPNLPGVTVDPGTGLLNPPTGVSPITGFRRTTGERAAPPYVGRGLMEAISDQDILALADPLDQQSHNSSLNILGFFPECTGDCIAGRPNQNVSNLPSGVFGGDLPARPDGGSIPRLGRFGLRAAGPTLVQFVVGGMQGELGFTPEILRPTEVNQADINIGRPGCVDTVPDPEVGLSTVSSIRSLIRLTTLPEFGRTLLKLLQSPDPTKPRSEESREGRVQRGAVLFGVDLRAFANRMIPGRMPATGDGLDPHAINQLNRWVNCVGCHTPIQATGQSPAEVGARHLSNVWAPIFSDLLLHKMTVIDAERQAPTQRLPLLIRRLHVKKDLKGEDREDDVTSAEDEDRDDDAADGKGRLFDTFDVARNLADDTLPAQGLATGDLWRTPPLMGLGRVGPPFLHDARVYLSRRTAKSTPAGTVMTSSEFTNAPLVVRTLDDALRAVIELHDLPAPDDAKTPKIAGAGCPVAPGGSGHVGAVNYGSNPADVICPPFDSATSRVSRSEAREVIRRFRALSPEDQQALIEFLKEL